MKYCLSIAVFLPFCVMHTLLINSCTGNDSIFHWKHLQFHSRQVFKQSTGASWNSASLMRCLVETPSRCPTCKAARFRTNNLQCQAGSISRLSPGVSYSAAGLVGGNSKSSSNSDTVYSMVQLSSCDTTQGFILVDTGISIACLYLSADKMNFFNAKYMCAHLGAQLLSIHDTTKLNLLESTPGLNQTKYLIGLKRKVVNNKKSDFQWTDGQTLNPTSPVWSSLWALGRPLVYMSTRERCATFQAGQGLYDTSCAGRHKFACEKDMQ